MKVSILGSGSWGTALASLLADNHHETILWSRREDIAHEINTRHTNERYLPDVSLPSSLSCTTNLTEALKNSPHIVLSVPSSSIRCLCHLIKHCGVDLSHSYIVHTSKGIEKETHKTISSMVEEELGRSYRNGVSVLSGPSHAEEVARKMPTSVTIASPSALTAYWIEKAFSNEYFRCYIQNDVTGVELGGALKNIMALAAGISDGLGYGDNTKTALITRGLHEMIRLGMVMGAKKETFCGLSGIGDLVVTCTSQHSRNWKTGYMFSKGASLSSISDKIGMVAEGVKMTECAFALSQKLGVDMPITTSVYRVLFENAQPEEMVSELMSRAPKDEQLM
ncbi:NAD(P)H-dependent glycerol-3-phosphate dehydrogenase (plasmid) [Pontibacillus sp. ALD_SL1]|uniref:NAD(P)H-dependent glycerol-3-phosphate dehydrogenase n=1 Tax=Pontibacillus sp. ALD_SL1 TaxID=2777185 RepID=UPI001A978A08|nr:NAD(P)H-dependent glycerol-3-phosphate dehydrogenase [Pontibacillus sp. ALD_SL1]QST02319.1 NAD(P)H-dependent glycerol-3-phosphate dehydrogenase [Pontibacillus sp. ALD_SL1]